MRDPNKTINYITPAMMLGISIWDVDLIKDANKYENGHRYDWFYDLVKEQTKLKQLFDKALEAHGENDTPMNLFAQFVDLVDRMYEEEDED